MGTYAKLYSDFVTLVGEMGSCLELMGEQDKEIKKMAEDDM